MTSHYSQGTSFSAAAVTGGIPHGRSSIRARLQVL
jgi:hypothetical protein